MTTSTLKLYPNSVAKKLKDLKITKLPAAIAEKAAEVKAAARKAAPKKTAKLDVSIDFPQEGETVRPGHYSVRLTAAGADQAQIKLSDGEWADCRESVGHFWYDWAPQAGGARIEARARSGKGRWAASPARVCVVEG